MHPALWGILSAILAAVSGGLVYVVLSFRHQSELSHHQTELARQREELAVGRAALRAHQETLEASLRNAEESARLKAMDEFLADIRIEERTYTREHKVLFMIRRSLIRQERIFFRNIPLSNWIEQEMPFEEGADVDLLAKTMSVFAGELPAPDAEVPVRRLLRQ